MVEEQKKSAVEEKAEIELDFSKIFGFAKNFKFEKLKTKVNPVLDFVKNHKTLCVLLLVILLQFLPNLGFLPWGGIWMRMQSRDLTAGDLVIENSVNLQVRNQIIQEVEKQWPNLNKEKKEQIIREQIDDWKKNNKNEYEQALSQQKKQFKDHYRFEYKGREYPYMPDIDPYSYVRYAQNYLERGHFGDELKDGVPWDNHAIAPLGRDADIYTKVHVLVIAYFYKFWSFFNSSINILYTTSYLPVIFVFLSIFPLFFFTRRLSNNLGAFVATSFLLTHFMFLSRTSWGYADTDFYNVFFPLVISWVFFEAVMAKEWRNKLLLSAASALLITVFGRTWLGWWFVFDLLIISSILTICYKLVIKNFIEAKKIMLLLGSFLLFSFIFMSIFTGPQDFLTPLRAPFNFQLIKEASQQDLWPNVYTTVAELSEQSAEKVIFDIGLFVMVISAIGVFFLLIKRKPQTIMGSFYLILWFLATLYASTKGVRFLLLLISSVSILFGIGSYFVINFTSRILQKYLKTNRFLISTLLFIIVMFLFTPSVTLSYKIVLGDPPNSIGELPLVNDAWWDALTYIKENSEQNAIITSWWDFGHHFKFIADRAVTFDGASQNSPMAHWVGKLLLTNDENESIGILRMLDCGSNSAFEEINKKLNDTPKSIKLIYDVIKKEKDDAEKVLLAKGFDKAEASKVLNFTHCNPPQAFVITSEDMIGKAGVWSHFGNWDFVKSDLWNNYAKKDEKEIIAYLTSGYAFSDSQAENLYGELKKVQNASDPEKEANSWIGDWVSYVNTGNPLANCNEQKENLVCENRLVMVNETPYFFAQENNVVPLESFQSLDSKGNWQVKTSEQKTGIDAILVNQGGKYSSIVAQSPLAGSIFTKLFFFNGHGLKHFKLVKETRQIIGGKILVWEVDWKGEQNNVLSGTVEKEKAEKGDTVLINYVMWNEKGILATSIKDWEAKNATKDSKFEDYETIPIPLPVKEQLQKDFFNAILGAKKGEEKVIKINIKDTPLPDDKKAEFGDSDIYFRIKVIEIR
ncbi:hypothetical protein HZA97_03465 [Candidatus Woesearchaeota archaeon]|nr:hypothetical protein [Candidatus Woesearchaeota archaeon]